MSYEDPFALNDALAAVRDQVDRWDRLTKSSAVESALAVSQDLTRQFDKLSGRDLAAQVADAAATVPRGYEDLTAKIDQLTGRSLMTQVAEATAAIPEGYEDSNAKIDMLGDLSKPVAALEDQVAKASGLLPAASELGQISSLDRMIRGSLAGIDWYRLHGAFDFSNELARLTDDLTTAYRKLALQPLPSNSLLNLDTLPAVELYAHVTLLSGLGHFAAAAPAEADEEETEESRIREEIDEGGQITLVTLLADYDPDLLELKRAADEGLTNEYYAALKFCSAQRELLRKLLQKAAPDGAVRKWTTNPKYISQRDKNLVTMSGRIAYVCDQACRSGYTHFATTDAEAAAGVWNLLNKGVKQVPARLTRRQVAELRIRSNCLILMALQLVIEATN